MASANERDFWPAALSATPAAATLEYGAQGSTRNLVKAASFALLTIGEGMRQSVLAYKSLILRSKFHWRAIFSPPGSRFLPSNALTLQGFAG